MGFGVDMLLSRAKKPVRRVIKRLRKGFCMKFTDGGWLIRKGFRMLYPVEVHDWESASDELTIFASPKHMTHRGDEIGSALLEMHFSSPLPDVVRVQIAHYTGAQRSGPHFQLQHTGNAPAIIDEAEQVIQFASGKLAVNVCKGQPWTVDFTYAGRRLTRSSDRNTAYIVGEDDATYVREQLDLAVGECVYGFGERFTAFVKNGQVVETWNCDGGTSSEQAYKNVPFYVTNQGYGIFVNHPELVSFEVASERVAKVQFSVSGEYLEYYVIGGSDLKQVLENYARLTGKPALPPAWSFGLWLSTSFITNYDEQTVTHFIAGMARRDLPLSVFHFDCFWMKGQHWCDFEWDERIFPDPEAMLQRLKKRGLKICVWINPYIAQRSYLFTEGKEHGYLLKKANGDIWQSDQWQAGAAVVDFTNPQACEWYASKLRKLVAMGVDCFKTDFGERIPTEVVYYDGSDPLRMHNYYAFLYNKVVFDMLESERGRGEAVVFARAATAGSQQFPVHWGGDSNATYESMAESLRGGLSFGLSGFGFWSHDIGGFENTSTADVYKRWIAFGMLSSHSRLHGGRSYRVPWYYDEEAVDVLRFFTKLKCRLMPYLYAVACQAAQRGLPLLRAMVLEFQHDPACDYLDRQYMFGEALLVAPVFTEDGSVSFYLPQGTWTNFFTGEQIEGEVWRSERHGYLSLPLYVRPNSIIALGREENRPDYDFASDVELHIFALQDGGHASATVCNQQGLPELQVYTSCHGNKISINTEGTNKPWSVVLRGIFEIASVEGADYKYKANGIQIIPNMDVDKLEIFL
jgi:alpha-D-xyloside xylohydrolase